MDLIFPRHYYKSVAYSRDNVITFQPIGPPGLDVCKNWKDYERLLILLFSKFSACSCSPYGVTDDVCNSTDGSCICKDNFGGADCGTCEQGFYNFPFCLGRYTFLCVNRLQIKKKKHFPCVDLNHIINRFLTSILDSGLEISHSIGVLICWKSNFSQINFSVVSLSPRVQNVVAMRTGPCTRVARTTDSVTAGEDSRARNAIDATTATSDTQNA